MTSRHPISIPISFSMASRKILLTLSVFLISGTAAGALSYDTSPLPGPGTTSPNSGLVPPSRFPRRPDYRQLEQQQAQQQQLQTQQAQGAQLAQLQAQAAQVSQAKQLNQKAVTLGRTGHLAQAIQLHEKAVQLDPANKQLRINLSAARAAYGKQRLAAGDLNTACTLFRKALAIAPDNGLAGKLLSETLKKMGKNPGSADVRLSLGDQLVATGNYEGAAIEYEAALQLEQSARTYTKIGDIALRYGQTATAVNWYQQALMKDPNYGPAYRQLGFLQAAQGDYTGAASSLRKALIGNPQDSAAAQVLVELWRRQVAAGASAQNHLGLAGALQLSGDLQGAAAEYREVQMLDPHNTELEPALKSLAHAVQHQKAQRHYEAAGTLFGQGLIKDALAEIGQAVISEPRNAEYQFLLGQCLESSGDYEAAKRSYLSCVIIDPENSRQAAARLHDMEASVKNRSPGASSTMNAAAKPEAVAPAKSIMGTDSTGTDPILKAQLDKAAAAEAEHDSGTAIAILDKAAKEHLNNAEVHHRYAVDLLAAGRISEAISEFRVAADLSPANKAYAEDLDQAIIIHKKALAGDSDATAYGAGRTQQ
jgi:tetratricopeptide (TPR) repeat protein